MTGIATHEDVYKGAKIGRIKTVEELVAALAAVVPAALTVDDVVFLCIGTDRSSGDALGPFVGTYLRTLGYRNVYGTIDNPVHANNLVESIALLPAGKKVIAIDAALGRVMSIGTMCVINGPLKPGAGVNRVLPYVGDYSINAIVNVDGFMEYQVLQCTRLSLVMQLARDITAALVTTFPRKKKRGRPRKIKLEEALM